MQVNKEEFEEEFQNLKTEKEFKFKMTKKIFDEECGTSKTLNFEKIGLIEKDKHIFKSGKRKNDVIPSPKFSPLVQGDNLITEDICYLWVLKKNEEYFLLYVGQTSQTFEKRFNSGHRAACRERKEKHSNKTIRFMNILFRPNNNDEVQVWIKKSGQMKIFGQTVSKRKVEEDALIQLFEPYLNV